MTTRIMTTDKVVIRRKIAAMSPYAPSIAWKARKDQSARPASGGRRVLRDQRDCPAPKGRKGRMGCPD
jgi:hypothetical protein